MTAATWLDGDDKKGKWPNGRRCHGRKQAYRLTSPVLSIVGLEREQAAWRGRWWARPPSAPPERRSKATFRATRAQDVGCMLKRLKMNAFNAREKKMRPAKFREKKVNAFNARQENALMH